jgi:hypothetical protein
MCTKLKLVTVPKEIETVEEFSKFINNKLAEHNIDSTMENIIFNTRYRTAYGSDGLCVVDMRVTLKKLGVEYHFIGINSLIEEDAFTFC